MTTALSSTLRAATASSNDVASKDGSARARLLAQDTYLDLLCFDVGSERFATLLDAVDEVIDGEDLTFTATGGRVAGVLRTRGTLLPAHAPSAVLSCELTAALPLALVFPMREHRMALLVDHAEAAVGIHSSNFRELPALTSADRVLLGALRVGDRWVGLVDPDALVEAMTAMPAIEDVA